MIISILIPIKTTLLVIQMKKRLQINQKMLRKLKKRLLQNQQRKKKMVLQKWILIFMYMKTTSVTFNQMDLCCRFFKGIIILKILIALKNLFFKVSPKTHCATMRRIFQKAGSRSSYVKHCEVSSRWMAALWRIFQMAENKF